MLAYAPEPEGPLRVFFDNTAALIDISHLESSLRAISMGHQNWHSCWTEFGAGHGGLIQNLLTSCRLRDVDPYICLVDVLPQIGQHAAKAIIELALQVWRQRFTGQSLTSDLQNHGD